MIGRRRQPRGVPTGGQFATDAHPESGTTLVAHPEGMTSGVTSRFHEVKLVSAARMLNHQLSAVGPGEGSRCASWAHADADIALHLAIPSLPLDGSTDGLAEEYASAAFSDPDPGQGRCRRIDGRRVDELAQYALRRAMEAQQHLAVVADHDHHGRKAALGRRDAYARSYAELTLRSVDNQNAQLVADRLTDALADGITDRTELHDAAWNVRHPIDDLED